MPVPYCSELDVVYVLGQDGVDLRQDDTPGATGLYAQTTTSAPFAQPATAGTVTAPVYNGLWAYATQTVYVQGGGYYLVQALSASSLTLQNLGAPGSAAQGATVGAGAAVLLSPLANDINRASDEIDEHCAPLYAQQYLLQSNWVTQHAAVLAAYYFCKRRGNPAPQGTADLYAETKEKLRRVQQGGLYIPNIPMRKGVAPRMSNMRPALRPFPHAVVETQRSTGSPQGYHQNRDPYDRFGLNSPWIFDYAISISTYIVPLAGAMLLLSPAGLA